MSIYHLKCTTCQREYSPKEIDYTCFQCGPLLGTLEVVYDYSDIAKKISRSSLAKNNTATHWRYLPILPVDEPKWISPLAVGWTPLYPSPLGKEWGLKSLWIKDDGRNPTASYKDRASAVGLVKALEKGATTVTAASTGNAASSWSAFTALAGLNTVIFVPKGAPKAKIAQLLLYGAQVLEVQGTYDDAFDLCCQSAEKWGWYNRSTAINPYLGEGKKTGALEICEQLNWDVPDWVFVSVGDGCILQGLWKGFLDFYRLGLIDKLPKIVGVQAEGSAPLYLAWKDGAGQCTPMEPHTLADSISVGVPRDQIKALKAVRESKGAFVAVSDEQILEAISLLATRVGVLAEPAGATALAGLKKMTGENSLVEGASAVVLVTGHGLKDVDGVIKAITREPKRVEKDLTSVEKALK